MADRKWHKMGYQRSNNDIARAIILKLGGRAEGHMQLIPFPFFFIQI